jgi:RNA polymerase sigma factor (TIGR02999 family)
MGTPIEEIFPAVYAELRSLAGNYMRGERPGHTLQPTALVHEAYLRMLGQKEIDWQNREQVIGVAAQMMRRILLNYARSRGTNKRGTNPTHWAIDEALDALETASHSDAVTLDHAISKLSAIDERQGQIVELRFFIGLSLEETADLLSLSSATVKREWSTARLWLRRELGDTGRA